MGHYDSCYEADEKAHMDRRHKELNEKIIKSLEKLSINQKELISEIIDNVGSYISVIRSFKKLFK